MLHKTHFACKCPTGNCMSISCGCDTSIIIMSLNPCRRIISKDIWSSTVNDTDIHIICLSQKQMLVIMIFVDRCTVGYFYPICERTWRRSNSDTFCLSKEITCMRSLIICLHLPNFTLTVLSIMPQSIITIISRICCSIYSEVSTTSYDKLFAPVTKNITLKTRIILRIIVHVAT